MHRHKAYILAGIISIASIASFTYVVGEFSATRAAHFASREMPAERPEPVKVEEDKEKVPERYVAPAPVSPPFY
ncbi:MAG: hypothetical protein JJU11_16035 [Candidatus Sumerlaeia bacterium]|nr:hypothetical protein [Candidatus Sumerlaeia bacterium]